jgi:hypothetical protein
VCAGAAERAGPQRHADSRYARRSQAAVAITAARTTRPPFSGCNAPGVPVACGPGWWPATSPG